MVQNPPTDLMERGGMGGGEGGCRGRVRGGEEDGGRYCILISLSWLPSINIQLYKGFMSPAVWLNFNIRLDLSREF